jgi:hypothetical protein
MVKHSKGIEPMSEEQRDAAVVAVIREAAAVVERGDTWGLSEDEAGIIADGLSAAGYLVARPTPELVKALDQWRVRHGLVSRAQALCTLAEQALKTG